MVEYLPSKHAQREKEAEAEEKGGVLKREKLRNTYKFASVYCLKIKLKLYKINIEQSVLQKKKKLKIKGF